MYYVPGLSFQERMLQWAEHRYGLTIYRLPHFELAQFLKYGAFRPSDLDVSELSVADFYQHLRNHFSIHWIAAGERIADSIWRRAMIKKSSTIDSKRGRIFPVAHFTKAHIFSYLKMHRLPISEESRVLGFSFRSLQAEDMIKIRQHYPEDFAKIKAMFPLVEAGIKHREFYGASKQVSEI